MNHILVTIDELVLDGAGQVNQAQLQQAIQLALAQQVNIQGLPPPADISLVRRELDGFSAGAVAGQIAQTIYGGQK